MGRRPEFKTAKQEIADVIRWAERQGFHNIAEALRRALDALADK
jgi:hypothetical protein